MLAVFSLIKMLIREEKYNITFLWERYLRRVNLMNELSCTSSSFSLCFNIDGKKNMFRMKITRYYYLIKINKNSQEIVQLASKNFPSQITCE